MKVPNPELIAYTLFCDDVRHEHGHKYSAMGVYGTVLVIDSEQENIPKFVALTVLELPISVAGMDGHISLLDDEKILIEGNFSIPSAVKGKNGNASQLMAVLPIEAIPFGAKAGMKLQVRFKAGAYEYNSAILKVLQRSIFEEVEMTAIDFASS